MFCLHCLIIKVAGPVARCAVMAFVNAIAVVPSYSVSDMPEAKSLKKACSLIGLESLSLLDVSSISVRASQTLIICSLWLLNLQPVTSAFALWGSGVCRGKVEGISIAAASAHDTARRHAVTINRYRQRAQVLIKASDTVL